MLSKERSFIERELQKETTKSSTAFAKIFRTIVTSD